MKRYIHSSTDITDLDNQIVDFLGDSLIYRGPGDMFGRGGYVYIFRIDRNAYRVFCDDINNELIFQVLGYGSELNGSPTFDEPCDYKSADGNISNWFNLIKQWINECETDDPYFTQYE